MNDLNVSLIGIIVLVAGVTRGITGFGGAMVMSPLLALLLGPQPAVLLALVLEGVAPIPFLFKSARNLAWPILRPMLLGVLLFAPVGTMALAYLDPQVMRLLISVVVLGFAAVMLMGYRPKLGRYRSEPFLVGMTGGVMVGATSMGGPPAILYMLAGQHQLVTIRASLMLYVSVSSFAGLFGFWAAEIPVGGWLRAAVWLLPLYMVSIWAGSYLFRFFNAENFRRVTLLILIVSALTVLFF
jgi:uncharacterized membrane protein YfcA